MSDFLYGVNLHESYGAFWSKQLEKLVNNYIVQIFTFRINIRNLIVAALMILELQLSKVSRFKMPIFNFSEKSSPYLLINEVWIHPGMQGGWSEGLI